MTITAVEYVEGRNLAELQRNVTTAIAAGKIPFGSIVNLGRIFIQPMQEGTAPNALDDMQTDITTLQTDVDALQANATAPTAVSGDGAITIASGSIVITKGSAAALTLAAPTAPQAGTKLRIYSGTAFAHVITATNLLDDGVTGGSKDTATFAAFVGACIELEAYNLKWIVCNTNNVTIAGA